MPTPRRSGIRHPRAQRGAWFVVLCGVSVALGIFFVTPEATQAAPDTLTSTPATPLQPTASPELTETPTPTGTPEPTNSPSPTNEPASPGPTATAPPTDPTPSPTPTPGPLPEPAPTDEPQVVVVPAVPPAAATSTTSWLTVGIAGFAIVVCLVVLFLLLRPRPTAPEAPVRDPIVTRPPGAGQQARTLAALTAAGEAMIDSGYPVPMVRSALEDIARVNDAPDAEIVVFPTALLVTLSAEESTLTRVVSAGGESYLLYQVEAVDRAVESARRSRGSAPGLLESLTRVRELPRPFTRIQRVIAYALLTAGIAVLLDASWAGVAVATVLGVGVGMLLLLAERVTESFQVLVTVGVAFAVATIVFLLARTGMDLGVLPVVIAPVIILLPGGLLTTAVIELSTGHIMAGAARLAAGAMRLVLLAAGIVAAAALVGIPELQLTSSYDPLGAVAPWIAVAVFGVGIAVHQCASPRSIIWILLVLYVAYSTQVISNIFFGGVLAALLGAVAMTPVAVLAARQRSGPPAIVTFLPAFWLLVPGALGLVGVTTVLDGDSTGLATLTTTIATMVAIALGVLIGLAVTLRPRRSTNKDQEQEQLL